MPDATPSVIHWFRSDLRIIDNQSLGCAENTGIPVIPLYIVENWRGDHTWTGPKRQHFLCGCLESLAKNLEAVEGRLIIHQGDPVPQLKRLISESAAVALHFNEDPDPHGKAVEARVREMCHTLGVECHGHSDHALHGPDEILTLADKPYRVFTPYSRNWLARPKPKATKRIRSLRTPEHITTLALPTVKTWGLSPPEAKLLEPGERAARKRLRSALSGKVQAYAAHRDIPAMEGTSRISQDLRFGLISIRTVHAEAIKARAASNATGAVGIDTFIKELAWREFYFAVLHHFPNVLNEEFNADWRGLPWEGPGPLLDAWKQGRTGFPIVDAGMRQLLATGFMHNRVRMITAMFLTKDLHVDWKLGESHFMQHLVDGEIASNNGGWQWSAGTGADAAPYFRIQNPWSQTARYDPEGLYIKRWIPELKNVPAARFITPPENDALAPGYPLPCVNHKTERERTLAIFKHHRAQKLR
jgi:deoxyribodipyrimidine photo-lyase